MLPKPTRPREKPIISLIRVTYSILEYCDITGLSRAAVLQQIAETLPAPITDRHARLTTL